jgi:hypothetical protein
MIEILVCAAIAKEIVFHKVAEVSKDFGISESMLAYIVENEAARTKDGDFLPCGEGDKHMPKPSIGVTQISSYYHPEVGDNSKYLMFSLEWTASKLREGKCSMWTTCRIYKKNLAS